MNYNVVLWFSGFFAGAGVATAVSAIVTRLMPIRIKCDVETKVLVENKPDDGDTWKNG